MMGVNVDGYFFMAQAAVPPCSTTAGSSSTFASNAGLMGQAYTVAYCMTKGAVVQMTKAMAMEYVKTPLRVVAIAPGGVDTGLTRGYQMPKDLEWDLMGPHISPAGHGRGRGHVGTVRLPGVGRGAQHPRGDRLERLRDDRRLTIWEAKPGGDRMRP